MTRQVPEPGQGIIMWKSNRKEDERIGDYSWKKDKSVSLYKSL